MADEVTVPPPTRNHQFIVGRRGAEKLPGAIPLKATNIAPAVGERVIGHVPYGLTAIEGENMSGKSRLLCALVSIAVPTLRPGMVSITDGQPGGAISFGEAELRIEDETLGGKHGVKRTKARSQGPISELPDPVELMITGGDHVSDDANWRARLKALTDFSPVQVTDERLMALAGDDSYVRELLQLRHEQQPFTSMMDAADFLAGPRGELNRVALQHEKDADNQAQDITTNQGRLDEILDATIAVAGKALGPSKSRQWFEERLQHGALVAAEIERRAALAADLARVRAELAVRDDRQRERDQLRTDHGARPDVAAAEAQLEAAKGRCTQAAAEVARAREARLRQPLLAPMIASATEDVDAEIAALQNQLAECQTRRGTIIAGCDRQHERQATALQVIVDRAVNETEDASEAQAAAQAALDRERQRLLAWEKVERLLAEPVSGATTADVEKLEREHAGLAWAAELLDRGGHYRSLTEAQAIRRQAYDRTAERAASLRADAKATWDRLGTVMNEALKSSLVRVNGRSIEVMHEDGRWLDVADQERLSAGRLRRAFLDYFLERCDEGINIVVEDKIMLAIGPAGREELSARAAAKRVRLLFEQPADNPEPRCRFYGGWLGEEDAR